MQNSSWVIIKWQSHDKSKLTMSNSKAIQDLSRLNCLSYFFMKIYEHVHIAVLPDHSPSSRQTRTDSPDSSYPTSQENRHFESNRLASSHLNE